MDVILTRDVKQVGTAGQTVKVAAGFARNFLVPRGLARPATATALRQLEAEHRSLQALRTRHRSQSEQLRATLEQQPVTIPVPVGPDGKLFGAVTASHIAQAIQATAHVALDKRKIDLEMPLAALGQHQVTIELYTDMVATITVHLVKA